jgi:F0F1-type ATP synthase assembly protein I
VRAFYQASRESCAKVETFLFRSCRADNLNMTAQTERTLKTLTYGWIFGILVGAFLGWLLVPASFSVEYLTPIFAVGPFVGLIAGGILVRLRRTAPAS